jgi:hypothetical protein
MILTLALLANHPWHSHREPFLVAGCIVLGVPSVGILNGLLAGRAMLALARRTNASGRTTRRDLLLSVTVGFVVTIMTGLIAFGTVMAADPVMRSNNGRGFML